MTCETYLNRREAAAYLQEKFGSPAAVTVKTLAKFACCGGGPTFQHFGRKPAYKARDLDAWALARLTPPCRSTSDRRIKHKVS